MLVEICHEGSATRQCAGATGRLMGSPREDRPKERQCAAPTECHSTPIGGSSTSSAAIIPLFRLGNQRIKNFSVVLASLQGNYSFNRFLTFTSLVQMDTSNAQAVSANLRLRYNYRPDSDLYIIYNVGTQFASIAPSNPPQVRETRFAIKWTYSWQPKKGEVRWKKRDEMF